jgi:ectoine hydroxylase-related dioxygenase (phytanoyl-CoA dioxygenase family)
MVDAASVDVRAEHRLTSQQVRFFETFGFLRIPGFLGDDTPDVIEAFEYVFEHYEPVEMFDNIHFDQRRLALPFFLEGHPRLKALETDPRILGVVESLLGPDYEYRQTDGNLLWCDTSWHCDIYDSPLEQFHIKLFFYLDALDADTGALRVIPGSNDYMSAFARGLRNDLERPQDVEANFGVPVDEIPSWTVPNQPGDLVVGNYRTVHATFNGVERRRLFTMNYREVAPGSN